MSQLLLRAAVFFLFLGATGVTQATPPETDDVAVEATIRQYLDGTSLNNQSDIAQAFYPTARLYLDGEGDVLREMDAQSYAALFPAARAGQFNGRVGHVLSVDVSGTVATAKAEILMPRQGLRFIDAFVLKKTGGKWKIVSKSAHRENAPRHARKVIFAVSNADRYPGGDIGIGNNFPELAYAYDTFRRAGYTIDIVSPDGGPVPLEMIDTSNELLKTYLYDSSFMWALKRSMPVTAINADDYAGLVFIGGGAAMIGMPENRDLQAIAVRIHAQPGGVIGAICQGTEALTHLRLADGSYLIKGKAVTSFPDAFLNKNAPFFKAHPFSVETSLRRRGGDFRHGANGTSHVEVDGRLVTGMNWESTVDVARSMIRLMDAAHGGE